MLAAGATWARHRLGARGRRLGAIIGAAILRAQLAVEWNFYLSAVRGVVGAVLAALVPPVQARQQPGFV
ncbi:hypothetical protein [Mycobacterium sp.]|uniref:hypothetical protein n=1 Tax=Mycobacterium sp. TaxID=1785 RepID=UPI002C582361|nr:hypothetical protein [Mycobacterium sp.]HTH89853.1 hypothetical protein [Mycobacterium sp.]